MNATEAALTEAALVAREHFYGVLGVHPDLGFEAVSIAFVDGDWYVKCRVFSMLSSKMIGYRVIISDDKVQSIEGVD